MKASLQKSYCKVLPSKVEHCSGLRSIQLLLTPALLCHKYTAQGMQNSFIGGHFSLCLYGMRAPIIDSFCAWKPLIMHRPWRQHMYLVTFRKTVSRPMRVLHSVTTVTSSPFRNVCDISQMVGMSLTL